MKIKALIEMTGEVLEFEPNSPEQIMELWKLASENIKAWEKIKDRLKKEVPKFVDEKGVFEHGGFMFRVILIQRQNYDKAVLRRVFDEDQLDIFLEPNKKAIDNYLKENLHELGEVSTELRSSMITVGKPYQQIKLERLT